MTAAETKQLAAIKEQIGQIDKKLDVLATQCVPCRKVVQGNGVAPIAERVSHLESELGKSSLAEAKAKEALTQVASLQATKAAGKLFITVAIGMASVIGPLVWMLLGKALGSQ